MIDAGERRENRRRYWETMGPQYAARLEADRADLVARYWAAPQVWPDGIGDWYRAEDWEAVEERGVRVARRRAGVEVPPWPFDEAHRAKLGVARAALAEVEDRVGVRKGRPEVVGRPWEAEGISRALWYRRRAAAKGEVG